MENKVKNIVKLQTLHNILFSDRSQSLDNMHGGCLATLVNEKTTES